MDAASRTKVDDTRELLDNVQYAPSRGRYKVYLIDEVHMLSTHSFNALLKTLEEPPPHVKFLLATTDPQKLPVTVLSRCLQFHLKRLSPEQIGAQLEKILSAENIPFDAASLVLLARSADGSVRDALSLLDQAIAFGAGAVREVEVREMLGSIDDSVIDAVLNALAGNDAPGLLAAVAEACDHNADPESVLNELLLALHRLALLQLVPETQNEVERSEVLRDCATRIATEDVQLFYQIGLIGRRDIALAPDARNGLEMTLLRMLAFRPVSSSPEAHAGNTTRGTASVRPPAVRDAGSAGVAPRPAARVTPVSRAEIRPQAEATQSAPAGNEAWSEIVAKLGLAGLARELAHHCTLDAVEGAALHLILDQASAHLLNKEREAVLKQALIGYYGRAVELRITLGNPKTETPARERQRNQTERQQAAINTISSDPNVLAIQERFNAHVDANSIRPAAGEGGSAGSAGADLQPNNPASRES